MNPAHTCPAVVHLDPYVPHQPDAPRRVRYCTLKADHDGEHLHQPTSETKEKRPGPVAKQESRTATETSTHERTPVMPESTPTLERLHPVIYGVNMLLMLVWQTFNAAELADLVADRTDIDRDDAYECLTGQHPDGWNVEDIYLIAVYVLEVESAAEVLRLALNLATGAEGVHYTLRALDGLRAAAVDNAAEQAAGQPQGTQQRPEE